MKRRAEDDVDPTVPAPPHKRICVDHASAASGHTSEIFSLLPPELFLHEIFPASGCPRLARILVGLTCREAASMLLAPVPSDERVAGRLLVVDEAILAGDDWVGAAHMMLADKQCPVSALTTLDAIIVADNVRLFTCFAARYHNIMEHMADERRATYSRFRAHGLGEHWYRSPLDTAAYHGKIQVLHELFAFSYPYLQIDGSLRPCAESGKPAVLNYIDLKMHFRRYGHFSNGEAQLLFDAFGQHARVEMFWNCVARLLPMMTDDQQRQSYASFAEGLAFGGHLKLMIAMVEQHPYVSLWLLSSAINGRQIAVIRYCLEKYQILESAFVRRNALCSGNIEIIALIGEATGGYFRAEIEAVPNIPREAQLLIRD